VLPTIFSHYNLSQGSERLPTQLQALRILLS
jgi:hypothetical protein